MDNADDDTPRPIAYSTAQFSPHSSGIKNLWRALIEYQDVNVQHQEFDNRVKRLRRKRSKAMRSDTPAFIDHDGYVIVQAKSRARRFPILGLLLLALGFFSLKGVMIAGMSPDNYAIRIQEFFGSPSFVTRIGAWTMQGDAVSLFLAENIQRLL